MYDELIEFLLEGPYRIADILPERVPEDAKGQYPAVDRYFRSPQRLGVLYRKYAELLLKLNCYSSMLASFDYGGTFEKDPDPEAFAAWAESLDAGTLRVLFPEEKVMIDLDAGDTWMTVYGDDPVLIPRFCRLAGADGLFVWS